MQEAQHMTESTAWWLITGVLVAAELLTGTFFLLMLAFGAVAGALAALAGWQAELQMVVAALVGGAAVLAWYTRNRRRTQAHAGKPLGSLPDPDLALDLGQTVTVTQWAPDGSTQVQYRGTTWTARPRSEAISPLLPGPHRIAAMQGSVLLLDKV
jgi:membrane protein implicated in regulation of membrane protease activity